MFYLKEKLHKWYHPYTEYPYKIIPYVQLICCNNTHKIFTDEDKAQDNSEDKTRKKEKKQKYSRKLS